MEGDSWAFNHWSNSAVLASSLPSHCCLSSQPVVDVTCRSTVPAGPIINLLTASIPPLSPFALPAPGIGLVWLCCISSLDHTHPMMLIGLARQKKVYGTVKLGLRGGHHRLRRTQWRGLQGEMLEIVFSGKIELRFFPILPNFQT